MEEHVETKKRRIKMAKEVFVMGTKFYLDNPFNGEQKDGAQEITCNGWHFSQVNGFTLVEEVGSDVYYKFPSKDGVICVSNKRALNKVVYYRKKSLYLFLTENKIKTIHRDNPNTVYHNTGGDFRLVTDGRVVNEKINFSKVIGTHSSQHYSVKFEIADASFAILTKKQRTVLNTREPIEKVQKIINKHKEEIKSDQNCIVMLQK